MARATGMPDSEERRVFVAMKSTGLGGGGGGGGVAVVIAKERRGCSSRVRQGVGASRVSSSADAATVDGDAWVWAK